MHPAHELQQHRFGAPLLSLKTHTRGGSECSHPGTPSLRVTPVGSLTVNLTHPVYPPGQEDQMKPENQAQPEVEKTPPPAGPKPRTYPIPPSPRKELDSLHFQHAWTAPCLSSDSAGNPTTAEPAPQDKPELLKGFSLEALKNFYQKWG